MLCCTAYGQGSPDQRSGRRPETWGTRPRGLLAKVRDDHGRRPNVYSVTAKVLRAAGFPTVEAMRAAVAATVRPEEQMRLEAAMADSAQEPALQEATGS
jgi:hypothetical protein